MSKRRWYSPSKRVAEAEARASAEARFLVPSNKKGELAQQNDLWIKTDEARKATLTLSPQTDPEDEIILRAFRAQHLDWENPFAWKQLLKILADPHYGNKLTSGRKRKWTIERRTDLLIAVIQLKQKPPNLSESKICKKLALQESYKGLSAATLLKQLQYARRDMRKFLPLYFQELITEEAGRRGIAQTDEFREKMIKKTIEDAYKMVSGPNPRGRKPRKDKQIS
jgi:hypothetical protein